MKELNFDTGLVTYSINGKYELTFNPTNNAFAISLAETFEKLDAIEDKYKEKFNNRTDDKQIFAICKEKDAEAKSIIDNFFGAGACDGIFGDISVFALADGLPIWCNLFFAIMDEMDTSVIDERKKTNPRIAKYTSKYHK